MNKLGTIRTRIMVSEKISRGIHHRKPDQNKGVGDWAAFASIGLDDFIAYQMIKCPSTKDNVVLITKIPPFVNPLRDRLSTAWVSMSTNSSVPSVATIEENFARLANLWHNETDGLSSPSRITSNDSYLKIISMGKSIIPLILEDLKERGGYWFKALRILSGYDPISAEDRGDITRMKELWLNWGRERGYIK